MLSCGAGTNLRVTSTNELCEDRTSLLTDTLKRIRSYCELDKKLCGTERSGDEDGTVDRGGHESGNDAVDNAGRHVQTYRIVEFVPAIASGSNEALSSSTKAGADELTLRVQETKLTIASRRNQTKNNAPDLSIAAHNASYKRRGCCVHRNQGS